MQINSFIEKVKLMPQCVYRIFKNIEDQKYISKPPSLWFCAFQQFEQKTTVKRLYQNRNTLKEFKNSKNK